MSLELSEIIAARGRVAALQSPLPAPAALRYGLRQDPAVAAFGIQNPLLS